VTARNHPQSPIGFVAIIEMQAQSQHLFQEFDRCVDMGHSILGCPGSKTWNISATENGDGQILMPAYKPIFVSGFVKV
jgi:predicted secreted protein